MHARVLRLGQVAAEPVREVTSRGGRVHVRAWFGIGMRARWVLGEWVSE